MDHNGFHGFDHWMRALHNGRPLADTESANLKVVVASNANYVPIHGRLDKLMVTGLHFTNIDGHRAPAAKVRFPPKVSRVAEKLLGMRH